MEENHWGSSRASEGRGGEPKIRRGVWWGANIRFSATDPGCVSKDGSSLGAGRGKRGRMRLGCSTHRLGIEQMCSSSGREDGGALYRERSQGWWLRNH